MAALGIDVSSYQPPVTAAQLRGYDFAFTRVSDWSAGMGIDPEFAADWREIAAAGLYRGGYWFFLPDVDAVTQADFFVAAVMSHGLRPGDMLVCDSETTAPGVDQATRTFCDRVRKLVGRRNPVLVYTDLSVAAMLGSCTAYDLWIAWPSATPPRPSQWAPAGWPTWRFWQSGTLRGVDQDAYNGTAAELAAWIATYVASPDAEDNMIISPTLGGPAIAVAVPAGSTKLLLTADDGFTVQVTPLLRVATGPVWKLEQVSVTWSTSPVVFTLPAGATRVTIARLDQGAVPIDISWA